MYLEVVDRLGGKHYGSPAFSVADSCTGGVRGLVFMIDDKPPPSLEELDSRLKKIQEERQRPEGLGMPPTRTGQSLHLGIEMAATLMVGAGIGWFLDSWLDTTPWQLPNNVPDNSEPFVGLRGRCARRAASMCRAVPGSSDTTHPIQHLIMSPRAARAVAEHSAMVS